MEGSRARAGRAKKAKVCKGKGKENKLIGADDQASSTENLIVAFSCLTITYSIVEYNTVYYSKIPYDTNR